MKSFIVLIFAFAAVATAVTKVEEDTKTYEHNVRDYPDEARLSYKRYPYLYGGNYENVYYPYNRDVFERYQYGYPQDYQRDYDLSKFLRGGYLYGRSLPYYNRYQDRDAEYGYQYGENYPYYRYQDREDVVGDYENKRQGNQQKAESVEKVEVGYKYGKSVKHYKNYQTPDNVQYQRQYEKYQPLYNRYQTPEDYEYGYQYRKGYPLYNRYQYGYDRDVAGLY